MGSEMCIRDRYRRGLALAIPRREGRPHPRDRRPTGRRAGVKAVQEMRPSYTAESIPIIIPIPIHSEAKRENGLLGKSDLRKWLHDKGMRESRTVARGAPLYHKNPRLRLCRTLTLWTRPRGRLQKPRPCQSGREGSLVDTHAPSTNRRFPHQPERIPGRKWKITLDRSFIPNEASPIAGEAFFIRFLEYSGFGC